MTAAMWCGSLGSSQNGWSSSVGIEGRHALAGEIEIVDQPAVGHEEADELLGGVDVGATLEGHGLVDSAFNWEMTRHEGPSGHSIVVVFS